MSNPEFPSFVPLTDTSPHGEPLAQPLYNASFGAAVQRFFKKYATFTGRASRSEYWWVALMNVVVMTVVMLGAVLTKDYAAFSMLDALYALIIIVPSIALTMRRLHDANFSGALILLDFVPFVGALTVTIMMLLPSNPAGARYDAGFNYVGTQFHS